MNRIGPSRRAGTPRGCRKTLRGCHLSFRGLAHFADPSPPRRMLFLGPLLTHKQIPLPQSGLGMTGAGLFHHPAKLFGRPHPHRVRTKKPSPSKIRIVFVLDPATQRSQNGRRSRGGSDEVPKEAVRFCCGDRSDLFFRRRFQGSPIAFANFPSSLCGRPELNGNRGGG